LARAEQGKAKPASPPAKVAAKNKPTPKSTPEPKAKAAPEAKAKPTPEAKAKTAPEAKAKAVKKAEPAKKADLKPAKKLEPVAAAKKVEPVKKADARKADLKPSKKVEPVAAKKLEPKPAKKAEPAVAKEGGAQRAEPAQEGGAREVVLAVLAEPGRGAAQEVEEGGTRSLVREARDEEKSAATAAPEGEGRVLRREPGKVEGPAVPAEPAEGVEEEEGEPQEAWELHPGLRVLMREEVVRDERALLPARKLVIVPAPKGERTDEGGHFTFRAPLDQMRMTSPFGMRMHPKLKKRLLHKGVDFGAPKGTPVKATGPGKVIRAEDCGAAGNCVVLEHPDGWTSAYFHLSKIDVKLGEEVEAEQLIGKVGSTGRSTGPHLHFQVEHSGEPVDPKALLGVRSDRAKFE
jgi:murein DD-endopeptidase MepM/ murein hydrolase activator NlpD